MARPVPQSKLAAQLGINPRKWLGLPKPPKPQGIRQHRVDKYRDELQEARHPVQVARESSHDKRTINSVQRLTSELESKRRPKEVARELGLSYQRWTAIKKGIKEGKIYGPEIRENLRQALVTIEPEYQRATSEDGSKFDYFADAKTLSKLIPWNKKITPHGYKDRVQAERWWQKIGGGADYFVIACEISEKTGEKMYNVYDVRTAGELKNKGKLHQMIRAKRIIKEEYGDQGEPYSGLESEEE